VKPGGQGALDIPQDTLEHRKVRLSRVVHEEANLLKLVRHPNRQKMHYLSLNKE
jgi:hypothetical protein